ncbi:hypothetical protein OYC64_001116 [Pagothenia borchgrevinki]|uniref:Uncharacterized protein n=1 Tax=Pagothenia borchgrevinki TaxID=8213 RepID=A0ABD2HG11_PAGBO
MGNKQTTFTDEQLEAFQDCTFFTRKEILRLHGRYRELAPHLVPLDFTNSPRHQSPPDAHRQHAGAQGEPVQGPDR